MPAPFCKALAVHIDPRDLFGNEPRAAGQIYQADFLKCVRCGDKPHADIEEAHRSTLRCHLGNIAYRVQRTLRIDAKSGHIIGDPEAAALWSREYRPAGNQRVHRNWRVRAT